jgi:uncharacterized protein
MIYKNQNLVITPIDERYFSCTNPLIKNWIKVITKAQYDFLNLINYSIDEKVLWETIWCDENTTNQIVKIFVQNDILNTTWNFDHEIVDNYNDYLNLWVHTTDKCNLRCTYCNIKTKLTLKDMWEDVMDELCLSLLETVKIHHLKWIRLRLSWWEPTIVYKKWLDKLKKLDNDLKNLWCKLWVAFLSNGTLIKEDTIETIMNNKIWLSISMDWINEYNKNRVTVDWKNSFEIVKANIEKVLENWITPNILTVVSNENMEWLPELTKYFISKNLPFRYSFVQWEQLNKEKLINAMEECFTILENAIDQGYEFTRYFNLCDLKFLNPWNRTCSSWVNWWAIYIDWWIYFCQTEFWDKNQELWNIKENKDILWLIKKWEQKTWILSEDCNTCSYRKICTWGCPLERVEWKDVHCEIYKVLIPQVYRLMWKERLLEVLKNSNDSKD